MADETIRIPQDAVRRHAAGVAEIADAVRSARSAVHQVTMDTQTYGQLCQFLPGLMSPLFGLALDALDNATDSLQETAHGLRVVSDEAATTDEAAARRVDAAGRQLDSPIRLPL
jgi:hypothetical protein